MTAKPIASPIPVALYPNLSVFTLAIGLVIIAIFFMVLDRCFCYLLVVFFSFVPRSSSQVNPAVWEMSGHMVLKRKEDYEGASKKKAWSLLAEVSLSEERFKEVKTMIFEAIGLNSHEEDEEELEEQRLMNGGFIRRVQCPSVKEEAVSN